MKKNKFIKLSELHPMVKTHKCFSCNIMIRVKIDGQIPKYLKCKTCRDGVYTPLNLEEQHNAWMKSDKRHTFGFDK